MQKGGNHTFLIVSSIADGTFKNHFYTILYMYVIHSDKASIHPLSLLPLFPISWCFFPPSFHPTITSFGFASVFPLWFSVYPGLLMWARMCSYQLDQLDQESVTPGCITGKNDSPPPLVAIHYCCCPWALLTSMTGLQYLLAQLWACPVLRTEAVVNSWNSWPCHAHKAALLASLPVISSFHDVPWALEGVLRISCWELTPHWSLVPSTLTSCVSLHWSPISIMRRVWSLPRTTLVHWYKHKYLRNSLTTCPLKMSVVYSQRVDFAFCDKMN